MPAVVRLPLSEKFRARVNSLYASQQNRARTKQSLSGRITKRGYDLPFDRQQFAQWFLDRFGGAEGSVIRCRYCKCPIDAYSCVVDHATPLKRGGSPGLENLNVICEQDNQIKGGMTPEEYEWFLLRLVEMNVRFPFGSAVRDITSRLQKAVALAASVRWARAQKAKQNFNEGETHEQA